MGKYEIAGYEPLVHDLKELIHKKQYHALQLINSETIDLYWDIGEKIFRKQEENGWGKSIVQILSKELQNEFPGAKGYSASNLWRGVCFEAVKRSYWCGDISVEKYIAGKYGKVFT